MLWALGQPAAAAGLVCAFLLGLGIRLVAQRVAAAGLRLPPGVRPDPRRDVDPLGALAALFAGTGWGRPSHPSLSSAAVLASGPCAVLVASQVALLGYRVGFPSAREALRVNYPSDVLRGVVVAPSGAQLLLSVSVGLLCFGLLALVPLPPLDGYALCRLAFRVPAVPAQLGGLALVLLLAVPVGVRPSVLLQLLDVVGAPLVRAWA